MRMPELITFTGADDHTSIDGMIALASLWPGRVEFAILFSPTRIGTPRYPSRDWYCDLVLKHRATSRPHPMRLAAHLCGGYVRNLGQADARLHELHHGGFSRVQFNSRDNLPPSMIRDMAARWKLDPILQCRGEFPDDQRVAWLFDESGGEGRHPTSWPRPPHPDSGVMIGYAGGIGPANVLATLEGIHYPGPFWIDMETGVRTDDRFDLAKCREVCEAVFGTPFSASRDPVDDLPHFLQRQAN